VLSPREDVALAAVEAAALVALALLPVPMAPAVLLGVASVALWIRGASFSGPPGAGPEPALIGLAVGAAALLLSAAVAGPVLEAIAGRAVEWYREPAIRGSAQGLIAVLVLTAAAAVASELAFRGWVAARVVGLWPRGGAMGAVAIAALAEAVVSRGSGGERLGVLLLGLGTGALWAGSGRRVGAAVGCRLVFEIGAVVMVAAGWLS
jgi:hypothetical protein